MANGQEVSAELLAALVARCGGHVTLGRKELEAAATWRLSLVKNPVSGDVDVSLVE